MQRLLGNRQIDAVEKIDDNAKREQKCDGPSSSLRSGIPGAGRRCAHYPQDLRAILLKLAHNGPEFPTTHEGPAMFLLGAAGLRGGVEAEFQIGNGRMIFSKAIPHATLSFEEIPDFLARSFRELAIDRKRLLIIIPDGTRTMPMPLLFDLLQQEVAPRTAACDFLVALGTHPMMSDAQLTRLLGVAHHRMCAERDEKVACRRARGDFLLQQIEKQRHGHRAGAVRNNDQEPLAVNRKLAEGPCKEIGYLLEGQCCVRDGFAEDHAPISYLKLCLYSAPKASCSQKEHCRTFVSCGKLWTIMRKFEKDCS